LRSDTTKDSNLLLVAVGTLPVVAVGSFPFHTIATRWAEWADVFRSCSLCLHFYG
jgi:hypothetical protein